MKSIILLSLVATLMLGGCACDHGNNNSTVGAAITNAPTIGNLPALTSKPVVGESGEHFIVTREYVARNLVIERWLEKYNVWRARNQVVTD
jgi:hypothetical protein